MSENDQKTIHQSSEEFSQETSAFTGEQFLNTVIDEYTSSTPIFTGISEENLESKLKNKLENQGYEYVKLSSDEARINNIKTQIEKLNNDKYTDDEWHIIESAIKNWIIQKNNNSVSNIFKIISQFIYKKSDFELSLKEGEKTKTVVIFDRDNPQRNILQVTNQFTNKNTRSRYDVMILVNGFPLVQIELKKPDEQIDQAFNQSIDYATKNANRVEKENLVGMLSQFVQLYVISNGNKTKYFSNNLRMLPHDNDQMSTTKQKFDFTSY